METKTYNLIYVTTANLADARRIGRELIEQELVACVNLLDGMKSIYRWQGEICEDSECVLLAKTPGDLVEDATALIIELHDYECPCVVALPITGGSPEFLRWLNAVTKDVES